MMHVLFGASIGLLVLVLVYLLLVAWDAKHDVGTAPRTDMFVCDRHGAMPASCAFDLQAQGILSEPIKQCPFCLEQQFKRAKQQANE